MTDLTGLREVNMGALPNAMATGDLPAAVGAKIPLQWSAASRFDVDELLQGCSLVYNPNLVLLNVQVARDVAPCDLAAVGAVAEVAATLCPEFAVGDGYLDGATETGSR